MNIAIVTGASSGLGAKFADKVCKMYPDLDEVWVVARRKERLEEFAAQHKEIKARPVALDLSSATLTEDLTALLKQENADIKMLVHAAGYDVPDYFENAKEKELKSTIDINVTGTTMLYKACLPFMHEGSFGIITGSIGSFAPLPGQAVYAASKAYCRFLSIAIREELKPKGINVMLLSPGNMKTEMYKKTVEHITGGKSDYGKFDRMPFLDLDKVTTKALRKAEKGCTQYTPKFFFGAYHFLCKIIPFSWMVKFNKVG